MMTEQGKKPEAHPWARLAGEQTRTVCLLVIAVCVAGVALWLLGHILTPLLIALFLFFLSRPVAEEVVRWRVPRWVAYPLLFVLVLLMILLFGTVIYSNAGAFHDRLPLYQQKLVPWVNAFAQLTGHANPEGHFDWDRRSLQELFELSWQQFFKYVFGTTLGFVETSFLVLFYLLFIFVEAEKLPKRVRRAYPPEAAAKILHIGRNIEDGIKRYLVLKTGVSLGLGITTGVLAYLFGLDFWPLWAVLMFLANYITYVGSIVALVPTIALAYLQFTSPVAATVLAVLLVLNRLFWIDYVEIRFSGKHLDISPLLLLVALALFGWLWGVVGMVLAVPLVTAAKIVLFNFERSRHFAILVSEE
jgi:predicted PurR-regulated permease PerM